MGLQDYSYKHHTILKYFFKKAYGQLVLLDFDITAYTSVAYQRGSLPRSL